MTNTQRYLAGLLLIQVVLILLFRSPLTGNVGSSESHALLPQLADMTASRIELQDAEGTSLSLENKEGAWSIVEADHFPADGDKIKDLLKELGEIEVRLPVVSSDRYHEAFKVTDENNEGRVRIWDDDSGDPGVELILGTSSNYQLNHVRLQDDDRVFEVRGLAPYDVRAKAEDWVEKSLVDIPAEQLVGLELVNPAGTIELAREDGQWILVSPAELAGSPLDQSKADDLARIVRTLRIESPAGILDEQASGLDEPAATVTLRFSPGGEETEGPPREVVVRVGSRLPDKDTQRYVTRTGFDFTATVWESSVLSLIEKTVTDMVSDEDESPADS